MQVIFVLHNSDLAVGKSKWMYIEHSFFLLRNDRNGAFLKYVSERATYAFLIVQLRFSLQK